MKKEQIVYKTRTAFGQSENIGVYALASVVNELAAEGAEEYGVSVRIFRPPEGTKEHMFAAAKKVKKACRERGIHLKEIKTELQAGVAQNMAIVTGAGFLPEVQKEHQGTMQTGQDIVMIKWAGMEGMLRLAEEKREEVAKRFAPVFLRQMEAFREEVFSLKEIRTAKAGGASAIYEIGEGGIFAALWRLSKEAGAGIDIDLKKIPVLQETIEVCEYLHLNPYQLASAGSLLAVSEQGEAVSEALLREGTAASVIGSLKNNNDKIMKNGEDIRYIARPAPDELNYIFMEDKMNERH